MSLIRITWPLLPALAILACTDKPKRSAKPKDPAPVHAVLDSFHQAAGQAQFDRYFSFFSEEAVFTGTDATERWDKNAFMEWARPYFERGRAWNFTALQRHVYFSADGETAWFDELLNTQMKICRGSGVLTRDGNDWKISQYILSMTVPNALVDSLVPLKAPQEDSIIRVLQGSH
ncbi:MAG: hypothetical protein RJA57_1780 [Bacteroidota bacterium]|jgi:hypothetical protein